MRIAMSVCVYYSLDHLFPQHGWVAHRNENCNVCMCILFPWSPIFPMLLTAMRIPMYICILFPWSPIFPRHGEGCWEKWELQCLYVYIIPLITYFPNMDGLLTAMRIPMYICILFPWSPIFPTWRGLLTEMRIAMSVCVYYSLDHLFPQHGGGCSQKWELQCLYVYIIPLITYFPNMEGVAHRNENCNVCMCILFPWSPISPTWRGSERN